jgi:hypothetical protein
MKCPKCYVKLSEGKQQEFETLCDHVCDPNNEEGLPKRPTFICTNEKCICSKIEIFWDEDGNIYGSTRKAFSFDRDEIKTAYPSHARRMDIEIYKKGQKKRIDLPAYLMLWVLKPMIEFNYKANDYGTVLKRTWKLKWLKKDCWYKKDQWGYHTYYTMSLVNIIHFLKSKYTQIQLVKRDGEETWSYKSLMESFEPIKSWDKRWWRHTELWLSKIVFRKWYLKSKKS